MILIMKLPKVSIKAEVMFMDKGQGWTNDTNYETYQSEHKGRGHVYGLGSRLDK